MKKRSLKESLKAVREELMAAGLPVEETEKRLKEVFEKTIVPHRDFIEETATVMHKFSDALGGCCYDCYNSSVTMDCGTFIFEGGLYISRVTNILSLRIEKRGTGEFLNFYAGPLDGCQENTRRLAEDLVSRGWANDKVLEGIEKLLCALVDDLKKRMKGMEEDLDALLGEKYNMSAIMKCEKIAATCHALPDRILPSCIEALKPLKEKEKEILEAIELLEDFEETFSIGADILDLQLNRTTAGMEFTTAVPEYELYIILSLERDANGNLRILVEPEPEELWYRDDLLNAPTPTIEEVADKLVNGNAYDKVQLLHLPKYIARLAHTALETIGGIEAKIEAHLQNFEKKA